jgi:hypothetical protein
MRGDLGEGTSSEPPLNMNEHFHVFIHHRAMPWAFDGVYARAQGACDSGYIISFVPDVFGQTGLE